MLSKKRNFVGVRGGGGSVVMGEKELCRKNFCVLVFF